MIYRVYFYLGDFSLDYYRVFSDTAQNAIEKILSLDEYAVSAILEN